MMADPWVPDDVIDRMCRGLTQPAAKIRALRRMGLVVGQAANGKPLVLQANLDTVFGGATETKEVSRIGGGSQVDLDRVMHPIWEETPLGRWQATERRNRAEEAALNPTATPVEKEAVRTYYAEETRLRKATNVRHHANKRRALKLQRTPSWADMEAIRVIYMEAQRLSSATGISYHVDHTIPLQGRLVSGLHVNQNLQIITGSENSTKSNHFEVES